MSKTLWITYAWSDNQDKDVDYIASRINAAGINTLFDRRALVPGQSLWEQIGSSISDRSRVDAFAFVVTPNSLASQPCKEELAYAIQRVMDGREDGFPVIGLMHRVKAEELPLSLKVRLCVSLSDPNWVEAVVAGSNKQATPHNPGNLLPYRVKIHHILSGHWIQITPRIEHASPVQILVDVEQQKNGNMYNVFWAPTSIIPGQDGSLSSSNFKFNFLEGERALSDGTAAYLWQMDNEATPSQSYCIPCKRSPPRIWFGNQQIGLTLLPLAQTSSEC